MRACLDRYLISRGAKFVSFVLQLIHQQDKKRCRFKLGLLFCCMLLLSFADVSYCYVFHCVYLCGSLNVHQQPQREGEEQHHTGPHPLCY